MSTVRMMETVLLALALSTAPTLVAAQEHDCGGEEGGACGGGEEGGCGGEEGDDHEGGEEGGDHGDNGHAGPGPMVCQAELVSGRKMERVGYLVVRDRACGEGFNITFHADPGYCLFETHLHVEDDGDPIPVTRKDVPIPGLFEYAQPHLCVDRVRYPMDDFQAGTVLAAHAVVLRSDGVLESAWAEGDAFEGPTWAMFVDCVPDA